jgi:hypothetical protein
MAIDTTPLRLNNSTSSANIIPAIDLNRFNKALAMGYRYNALRVEFGIAPYFRYKISWPISGGLWLKFGAALNSAALAGTLLSRAFCLVVCICLLGSRAGAARGIACRRSSLDDEMRACLER